MDENQNNPSPGRPLAPLPNAYKETLELKNTTSAQPTACSAPKAPSQGGAPAGPRGESSLPKNNPNMELPVREWREEHYRYFAQMLMGQTPGEMLMRICKIKRRKDLYPLVYAASEYSEKRLRLYWDDPSFQVEGKRALPALKIGSEGDMRISRERLTRMGVNFPPGTTFRLIKHNQNNLILQRMP